MLILSFSLPRTRQTSACSLNTIFRPFAVWSSLVILLASCGFSGVEAQQALKGRLVITGSTALEPLVHTAATLFEQHHPQVHIEVHGTSSLNGLDAVTAGQADIGLSDIYADLAAYPDPTLADHIVAVVPFTMIAAPDVTVASLTHQQLIAIFSTGTIRNWKAVGGKDMPLIPLVRSATSGTRVTFRKYVLGGRDDRGYGTRILVQKASSLAVREAVAHTPGALGYLALSVLTAQVRALAIDGKSATTKNINAGVYNFWAYEHLYTLGEGNPLVTAFLNFMLSPTIQQQARQLRYLPLADLKLPITFKGKHEIPPSLTSLENADGPIAHTSTNR